jgi:hypothetical protein
MEEAMDRSLPRSIGCEIARVPHLPAATGPVILVVILGLAGPARAVPSYSDQTGDPCTACHVGGFGPQLTAHGRAFKLTGYSDGTAERKLPLLSAMLESSWTSTAKNQSGPAAPGFKANDNFAVDQVSIFIAGRIYDHLGIFDQITWDGVSHTWAWDNLDLRYGRETQLGGFDAILGGTVNNNPTVTDPYNSTPAWSFPYAASKLTLTPPSTLIEGALSGRVLGGTVYGLFDDLIYAEVGAYGALPELSQRQVLGVFPTDGPVLNGGAPYWRLAVQNETPKLSVSLGTFGLSAGVFPANDRTAGTDQYLDIGFDGSFQWHATKAHVFTLYATAIRETAQLHSSVATGAAENKNFSLNTYKVNGSYYYDQTWGLTAGLFAVKGSHDALLYAEAPDTGSRANSPNSTGYVMQVDWTPFGKEDSWAQPWANLRLALQYTGYATFNGKSTNYDGNGRHASDNNTIYLLAWMAF